MKLEVGMYVRTKEGIITKIIDNRDNVIIKTDDYTTHLRSKVIKASFNIIDLIKEHDILKIEEKKGVYTICEVEVFKEPYEKYTFLGVRIDNRPIARKLYELNIKSIVTKEQFKANEYVIEK